MHLFTLIFTLRRFTVYFIAIHFTISTWSKKKVLKNLVNTLFKHFSCPIENTCIYTNFREHNKTTISTHNFYSTLCNKR